MIYFYIGMGVLTSGLFAGLAAHDTGEIKLWRIVGIGVLWPIVWIGFLVYLLAEWAK